MKFIHFYKYLGLKGNRTQISLNLGVSIKFYILLFVVELDFNTNIHSTNNMYEKIDENLTLSFKQNCIKLFQFYQYVSGFHKLTKRIRELYLKPIIIFFYIKEKSFPLIISSNDRGEEQCRSQSRNKKKKDEMNIAIPIIYIFL